MALRRPRSSRGMFRSRLRSRSRSGSPHASLLAAFLAAAALANPFGVPCLGLLAGSSASPPHRAARGAWRALGGRPDAARARQSGARRCKEEAFAPEELEVALRTQSWDCFTDIYCINLDKRPERWAYMREQIEKLDMPARRWSAVDGTTLQFEALVESGELSATALSRLLLPDDQKIFGMDLTPGAIGCAMSHYHVWIDIMWRHGRSARLGDDSAMYLVVEDDCCFLPGFSQSLFEDRLSEVPEDWQILFLGSVDALGYQDLLQISPGVRRVYNGSRETTAYAINIGGVRSALEVCFPLLWQLDTMLTLNGTVCKHTPELRYTTKPMGYVLWPPVVEQNKWDFQTDVQKDEHPRFLFGKDGNRCYSVAPEPLSDDADSVVVGDAAGEGVDAAALARSYSLVGSWNGWSTFNELRRIGRSVIFSTEVQAPPGEVVEFQVVVDGDWNRRLFPTPAGDVALGQSAAAHGRNWKFQVPQEPRTLHICLDPTGARNLTGGGFMEAPSLALGRTYGLVGSWNAWASFDLLAPDESGTRFTAAVEVPEGQDVEFQLVCEGLWKERLFPSPLDGQVLGPSEEAHGRNWRLPAPRSRAVLRVVWEPMGLRRLRCALDVPPESDASF